MAFGLLDDEFYINEKIIALEDPEFRLYVTAISRCRKKRTNGFVSTAAADELRRLHRIRRFATAVAGLVRKNAWEPIAGGWNIHGWKDIPYDRFAEAGKRGAAARKAKGGYGHGYSHGHDEAIDTSMPRARTPSPTPAPPPDVGSDAEDPIPGVGVRTSRPSDFEVASTPEENARPTSRDQVLMLWATRHGWPAGPWPADRSDDRVQLSARWNRYSLAFWQSAIDAVPVGATMRWLITPPEPGVVCRLEEWHVDWVRKRIAGVPTPNGDMRSLKQILAEATA